MAIVLLFSIGFLYLKIQLNRLYRGDNIQYMNKFLTNEVTINILVSVVTALITSIITVAVERKQKVSEIQRKTYMSLLKKLNLLTENPTLIYDDVFVQKLKDLKIEVELYANKTIKNEFLALYKDIEDDYKKYLLRYRVDNDNSGINKSTDPFLYEIYEEMLEKEEFDYKIRNLPNNDEICFMIDKLKSNIIKTLKTG